MNSEVDKYLSKEKKWQAEFTKLRMIILDCKLNEELKWGVPCYTIDGKNVVLIHGFKEYCAILFIKGALLHDDHNLLIQQTKNVQAGRQIRFTNIEDIDAMKDIIIEYISEAIEIEKAGLDVDFKKSTEFAIPIELQNEFNKNLLLKTSFESLTPGRQRAYILFFSEPKQAKTKEARIEKCTEQIIAGKGLND